MPLNSASRKALEEWFEARTDQLAALAQAGGEAAKAALWLSRTGKPMGSRAVDMVVRRLAAEAKLELSAHVLRHTFVTNLIRSGADIVLVAEIAGHRRLDTTRATACRRRPTRTRPSKRCFGETRATSATSRGPSVTPWWPASHPLGRSEATLAAFIPISKSRAWWDLTQEERRAIIETRSRHTATGLTYRPAVARRLHHGRDLGQESDFLTWFEFAPADAEAFEERVGRLRETEEWSMPIERST